jgi:hypothetical protein
MQIGLYFGKIVFLKVYLFCVFHSSYNFQTYTQLLRPHRRCAYACLMIIIQNLWVIDLCCYSAAFPIEVMSLLFNQHLFQFSMQVCKHLLNVLNLSPNFETFIVIFFRNICTVNNTSFKLVHLVVSVMMKMCL